jgi:hypothetical protein
MLANETGYKPRYKIQTCSNVVKSKYTPERGNGLCLSIIMVYIRIEGERVIEVIRLGKVDITTKLPSAYAKQSVLGKVQCEFNGVGRKMLYHNTNVPYSNLQSLPPRCRSSGIA